MPLLVLLVFAATLFTSAFLLFLVQPMVGKMITPLLGGTPAVWNTCMVFFQALLLVGYAYAHATSAWLGARRQAVLHLCVLLVPIAFFPLAVDRSSATGADRDPVLTVLLLLTFSVGVPFLVISTSAPLLQKWFASTDHPAARDPYFLYGASNLGSMLALLAYPGVVEPHLHLADQRRLWCVGYGLLVGLMAVCAIGLWRAPPAKSAASAPGTPGLRGNISALRRLRWVVLAAVPSSMMLGVTTYMTTDIAPIPLLWILPLALYLLSFILVFSRLSAAAQAAVVSLAALGALAAIAVYVPSLASLSEATWLRPAIWAACAVGAAFSLRLAFVRDDGLLHRVFVRALPPLLLVLLFVTLSSDLGPKNLVFTIGLHLAAFFCVAMVCHGELSLDRPTPQHLTEFFLWTSVGGVTGGLLNGMVAPLVFNAIVEYELAMVVAALLVPRLSSPGVDRPWKKIADFVLLTACAVGGGILLGLRVRDGDLDFSPLNGSSGALAAVALAAGAAIAVANLHRSDRRTAAVYLDVAFPVALALLAAGLYWGSTCRALQPRLVEMASRFHTNEDWLQGCLAFGVPAAVCIAFARRPIRFGLAVGALALTAGVADTVSHPAVYQDRSFFGVLRVEKGRTAVPGGRVVATSSLMHGSTLHGMQFRDSNAAYDRAWRHQPLLYYHRTGPVGAVFAALNTDASRPYGIIGLGVGTLAAYALPGQHVTFYEIDPVVRAISFDNDRYFSYVGDARRRGANVDLVMGDARLTMEARPLADRDKYGLLFVDAFSSDAVPIHLITREALHLYLERLRPNGVILFHVTNRYVDLKTVLANLAADSDLVAYSCSDRGDALTGKAPSTWVALARRSEDLARLVNPPGGLTPVASLSSPTESPHSPVPKQWQMLTPNATAGVWTDDYSNLLSVFRWR